MKRLFPALCLLALAFVVLAVPATAATRDPAPIVMEDDTDAKATDGRSFVGLFDFVRPTKTVCENGVCRTVPMGQSAPAPVVASGGCACGESCPCGAASSLAAPIRFRPLANTLERVRSWYPGKAIRAFLGR